ncbi:ABC transporter ATP-binding protein [Flagellimonas sp. HMM57]|uniref:ABC transporter ATP-binding protein n=1 Tax=unclassified Flagellimonas TaxID=2644544 RepID=UPI0013D6B30D|nr:MULTISPECIES: ABC transporter ATP-binding protein [unclassified Flagellimonas]UII76119.1 ABC transporter ATP-binding protein [Flagellimonas sp. HMM57]
MKPIVAIENLGKQYRLGLIGTGTLSHDLNRWWSRIRGKQDPYIKIGETNDRSTKGKSQYVWPLKDISLEVFPGEVLGIIGENGAGKSTLLKLLSRVTAPSEGVIKIRGRIASLLEVGTGFHPELTGRENIFLNGAILGMSKQEIKAKFNEIVAFAGCERYIDTPVKRYSSGMYVRLAFAVAAHLEPEILVVDEVLAVGDAEFQKKAIGKMKDASIQKGRTVFFVSHNMSAIKTLCTRCIVLDKGKIVFKGAPEDAVAHYLSMSSLNLGKIKDVVSYIRKDMTITKIEINHSQQNFGQLSTVNSECLIKIYGTLHSPARLSMQLTVSDVDQNTVALFSPGMVDGKFTTYEEGVFELTENICFPSNLLGGIYIFDISLLDDNMDIHMKANNCFRLEYLGAPLAKGESSYKKMGYIVLQ